MEGNRPLQFCASSLAPETLAWLSAPVLKMVLLKLEIKAK
jgi:hypothetical protein